MLGIGGLRITMSMKASYRKMKTNGCQKRSKTWLGKCTGEALSGKKCTKFLSLDLWLGKRQPHMFLLMNWRCSKILPFQVYQYLSLRATNCLFWIRMQPFLTYHYLSIRAAETFNPSGFHCSGHLGLYQWNVLTFPICLLLEVKALRKVAASCVGGVPKRYAMTTVTAVECLLVVQCSVSLSIT